MAVTDARARGAVLLDKDGTLLENVPYNVDPARMRLARGAARALATFGELGMPIAVVSNQPGVALGRFPETALGAARHRLAELFAQQGAMLAGFFFFLTTRPARSCATRAIARAASRNRACCFARPRSSACRSTRAG